MIDGRPLLSCDVCEVELLFRGFDRSKQRSPSKSKVKDSVGKSSNQRLMPSKKSQSGQDSHLI
jgi:hypothetical protein